MYTPEYRMRRLRANSNIRSLIRETHLSVDDFILPYFVVPGRGVRNAIKSMPGHFQLSIDELIKDAREAMKLGIKAVILFGIPESKDPLGSDAVSDEGIISRALRALKDALPGLYVITDVCFCEYTDHGHCGLLHGEDVENDGTLAMLQDQVRVHARNGADMVAPSGMMDGMVGAIRQALDEEGYSQLPIMSYAVKYASGFYGPFRDAAESAPQFGDRNSYQMDPANGDEAMREAAIDIQEGADIIMVKPAMPYLDILYRVKQEFGMPTAAYQVSGEFAMIKAAAANGWLEHDRVMMESLIAIKRAGADLILTYFAREAALKLGQDR